MSTPEDDLESRRSQERDALRDAIERNLEAIVWLQELEPPRMLHVSHAYERIWGRPTVSLNENPRDWIESIHPDDRARVEAAFERLIDGEPIAIEYRIRRPDGEVRWIRSRGTPFDDGRGHMGRAAGIAEDVTERKRAESALHQAERSRRKAAAAAERAEARERRILARDLHDAVSQSLALALAKLASLRDETGDPDRAARLREIESLVMEADERTRTLTFRLSPPILHDLGLVAATEWLADEMKRRFGLHVTVADAGIAESLDVETRESLFRSLRELLINVARHAQTHEVEVSLVPAGGLLTVTVEDGGIGFDVDQRGTAGFGLVGTRERIEALGGRLEIDSAPGRGTRARLVVPLPSED